MAESEAEVTRWTRGASFQVIPSVASAESPVALPSYDKVVIDGRTELASAAGERLRGAVNETSMGWNTPQTRNMTGYAINPDLELDVSLRAHGGWRGSLAVQRGSAVYDLAKRVVEEAAKQTMALVHEADCLDGHWPPEGRDTLLHRWLIGPAIGTPTPGESTRQSSEAANCCPNQSEVAKALATLATAVVPILRCQPMVVDVPAPCKVFGDVHGQLRSLLLLFASFGFPSHAAGDVQAVAYVFNGDWVDRGPQQLEVVALLFSLKLLYPERIYLLRGDCFMLLLIASDSHLNVSDRLLIAS